jgi:intein/homing endonuclease
LARAKRSLQSCGTDDVKTLAYIAGFFDGEGCIAIHKNNKDRANYTLRCSAKQYDKVPLELISLYFGGSVRLGWTKPHCKESWVWDCSTRYALKFLKAIEPYLISKRAEALLALEFQRAMITKRASYDRITERELAVREAQYILMQNLKNKKTEMIEPRKDYGRRNLGNLVNAGEAILAYIAGFFDGEGSISIHRMGKYSNSYTLSCSIAQIDKIPLEFVSLYFGGRVIPKKTKASPHMWVWSCAARYALLFLKTIEPYLLVKRAQALVAISFQYKMGMIVGGRGNHLSAHEIAVREADKILLHNLKHVCSTELPEIELMKNVQGVLF